LNRFSNVPNKYRNKKFSFEIDYGFTDSDEIEIVLPKNYKVAQLPEKISVKEKFGAYESEVSLKDDTLIYKRKIVMYDGVFAKEEYEAFRKFREQISKLDNIKIIIETK
jgi:hypothetical protein